MSSGSEVASQHARALARHFDTQGTPVMIGGGVLAYGLLGIDLGEDPASSGIPGQQQGEVRFLILDPHYTGADSLPAILKGGWCAWKKEDIFLEQHYYNFAMMQRPQEAI